MPEFKSRRFEISHAQHLEGSPSEVFPLLCPTREYDWIETWSCELIQSASGFAEPNCVFSTAVPHAEQELWIVSRYEPARAIEFVKFAADLYVVKYNITLSPLEGGRTLAVWSQIFTGLTAAGNDYVDSIDRSAYHARMEHLEKQMNHYLATGQMLVAA